MWTITNPYVLLVVFVVCANYILQITGLSSWIASFAHMNDTKKVAMFQVNINKS